MNPLNMLFGQISNAIQDHGSPNTPGPAYDTGGILSTIAGLFGSHAQQQGMSFDGGYGGDGNVQSSNQDPYGDPGNVQSSNQDPFGDPGAR